MRCIRLLKSGNFRRSLVCGVWCMVFGELGVFRVFVGFVVDFVGKNVNVLKGFKVCSMWGSQIGSQMNL